MPTTIADKLKIVSNVEDNDSTRILVQDSITKEVHWVLKSSVLSQTPSLQQVTTVGDVSTNRVHLDGGLDGSFIGGLGMNNFYIESNNGILNTIFQSSGNDVDIEDNQKATSTFSAEGSSTSLVQQIPDNSKSVRNNLYIDETNRPISSVKAIRNYVGGATVGESKVTQDYVRLAQGEEGSEKFLEVRNEGILVNDGSVGSAFLKTTNLSSNVFLEAPTNSGTIALKETHGLQQVLDAGNTAVQYIMLVDDLEDTDKSTYIDPEIISVNSNDTNQYNSEISNNRIVTRQAPSGIYKSVELNNEPSIVFKDYETFIGGYNHSSTIKIDDITNERVNQMPDVDGSFLTTGGTTAGKPIDGKLEVLVGLRLLCEDGIISFGDYQNVNSTSLINSSSGGLSVFSDNPSSSGLSGSNDFTANITDLDYPQKKYVDGSTQRTTATSGSFEPADTPSNLIIIHEAGTTTSLTINLPTVPRDKQQVTIMSVGGITALTLSTAVGSILNNVTSLVAGVAVKFVWMASQNKWYKI
jgi:hypothetical protein